MPSPRTSSIAKFLQLCLIAFTVSILNAQDTQQATSNKPTSPAEPHNQICVLHFKNGNKFTGKYTHWDKDVIELSSPSLVENFSFSTKLIKSVEFKHSHPVASKSLHQATVKLLTRPVKSTHPKVDEKLVGEITAIDAKSMTLKTSYADKLIISRDSIRNLTIKDLTSILIASPLILQQWKSHIDKKPWATQDNLLISKGRGHISTDAKLPSRSHISFDLISASKKINLWIYASKFTGRQPSSYYSISISSNSFSMQKVAEGQLKRLFQIHPKRRHYPSKRIKYDIYTDLNKGRVTIYTDGVLSTTYVDKELDREKLGSNIHLIAPSYPQTLRDFTVKKWSGILPQIDKKEKTTMLGQGENIILRNGDKTKGIALSVSDEKLKLRTHFGTFKIPLRSITEIAPLKVTKEPIVQRYQDITLYSQNNDRLIVRFLSFDGTHIKIEHPILGEQIFDLRAFSSVQFSR